jgi:IS66 C-terminal element
VLTSRIATSKRLGVNPFSHLRDQFVRMSSHPQSRLAELLPDQWKAAEPDLAGRKVEC